MDGDLHRLQALHCHYAGVAFVVDPDQGYSRAETAALIKGVNPFGGTILLLARPPAKDDLEGHATLRLDCHVPVAADESAQSLHDIQAVIQHRAADSINVKMTKSGLTEGIATATVANATGLGGMVEPRVAMGCSHGLGSCAVLDLDAPLLLETDSIDGGYTYEGPPLQPRHEPDLDLDVPSFQAATSFSP